jgi:peroxiredoxin
MANRGQWIPVVAIVVLLVAALVAGVALTPEVQHVGVGSAAPEFRAVDLRRGDTVGIEHYRGEVLLLNIWATWCAPCEEEMPSMQRLYDELSPHGLRVVAVSIDVGGGDKVLAWTEERLTFDILHDPTGAIEQRYQTTGVPESFVIDQQGTIVKKVIGALEWDAPAQQTVFRELLGLDHADVTSSTK